MVSRHIASDLVCGVDNTLEYFKSTAVGNGYIYMRYKFDLFGCWKHLFANLNGRGGGGLSPPLPFWEGRRLLSSPPENGSMGQPRGVSMQSSRRQGLWRRPGRWLRKTAEPGPGRSNMEIYIGL